jgi:hypothetical protein
MKVACSLDERAWNQLDPCDIFMGFDNGDFMAIIGISIMGLMGMNGV